MTTSHVLENGLLIDHRDGLVHVTLTRPEALNALTHDMIRGLRALLSRNLTDTILVTGAGGRAFCAGGDIKAQVRAIKTEDFETPQAYFVDEYGLNRDLFHYEGGYVAYLNGITMGGGYGVSAHGSHVVACEATQFAMPEVKIGFFPDIGAAYHLARVPYELGTYLALTGNTIGPADMIALGLAHGYVPLAGFDAFKADIAAKGAEAAVRAHSQPCGESALYAQREVVARCFAHGCIEDILTALEAEGGDFAKSTATDIKARSPLSVKIALRHIRQAAGDDFDAVIARDLALSHKFLRNPDFAEGVRASVIDKDRNPRWNPATFEAATDEKVALYFRETSD